MEPLDLPTRLRVVGGGVSVGDPQPVQLDLDGAPPATSRGRREHRGVVGEHGGRKPLRRKAPVEAGHDVGGLGGGSAVGGDQQPGVGPVGHVGLPPLVGHLGLNRMNDDRGRFWGWGITKPRRESTRQMVDTAGALPPRRFVR